MFTSVFYNINTRKYLSHLSRGINYKVGRDNHFEDMSYILFFLGKMTARCLFIDAP